MKKQLRFCNVHFSLGEKQFLETHALNNMHCWSIHVFSTPKRRHKLRTKEEPVLRFELTKFPNGPFRSQKWAPKEPVPSLEVAQRIRANRPPCILFPRSVSTEKVLERIRIFFRVRGTITQNEHLKGHFVQRVLHVRHDTRCNVGHLGLALFFRQGFSFDICGRATWVWKR